MDGKNDCIDGKDEQKHLWKQCHTKNMYVDLGHRYYENDTVCDDALICPGEKKSVPLKDLCDGLESCKTEYDLCALQKSYPKPQNTALEYGRSKSLTYCFPGLENLHNLTGGCRYRKEFVGPGGKGPNEIFLNIPKVQQDCRHSYGEL